jgi:catechol-2,3-dioxygenase
MIGWYEFVLGVKVNYRDKSAAWTTNDAANHRVAFLAVPGLSDDPQKVQHNGMHHLAFEYGSFADLMESYDRMRQGGVEPAFCLDHGLTISLYYRDPEGNFVELQSDNFGDWAASTEFMRTSADFAANPIGTFFDPAKVYDACKSGIEFKALQTSIRSGGYLPSPIPDIGLPA